MKHFLLISMLFAPLLGWSQYSSGFQQEYFFGRLPSARTEAMGRAGVAAGEGTGNLFLNPATLGLTENYDAVFSTSGPFYVLRESDYFFLAASHRFSEKIVGAFSINDFAIGPTTFDIDFGRERFPLDLSHSLNVAVSGAAELLPGLHAGLNLNLYRWTYIDEVKATYNGHIDVGLLYTKALAAEAGRSRELRLGLSVANTTFSEITFYSPENDTATQAFPAILRVGAAYQSTREINYPGIGRGPLAFTATAEYQNVLNYDYLTAFRFGTEVIFYDVLALRLGGFTRSEDDGGLPEYNFSVSRDITYGFGFRFPLEQITKGKVPCTMWLDYTSLESAPTSNIGGRLPNFRTFTFRFIW